MVHMCVWTCVGVCECVSVCSSCPAVMGGVCAAGARGPAAGRVGGGVGSGRHPPTVAARRRRGISSSAGGRVVGTRTTAAIQLSLCKYGWAYGVAISCGRLSLNFSTSLLSFVACAVLRQRVKDVLEDQLQGRVEFGRQHQQRAAGARPRAVACAHFESIKSQRPRLDGEHQSSRFEEGLVVCGARAGWGGGSTPWTALSTHCTQGTRVQILRVHVLRVHSGQHGGNEYISPLRHYTRSSCGSCGLPKIVLQLVCEPCLPCGASSECSMRKLPSPGACEALAAS